MELKSAKHICICYNQNLYCLVGYHQSSKGRHDISDLKKKCVLSFEQFFVNFSMVVKSHQKRALKNFASSANSIKYCLLISGFPHLKSERISGITIRHGNRHF